MGGTVPGKVNEMTCVSSPEVHYNLSCCSLDDYLLTRTAQYAGGVGAYHDEIRAALTGWQGFETVAA